MSSAKCVNARPDPRIETMKLLIIALMVFAADAASALSFSFDEIRKGISETAAIETARREGLVAYAAPGGRGHLLANARTKEIVSGLSTCSGRLYGYSLAAKGGVTAFVKQVAQFNVEFGAPGRAISATKMQSFGEVNTIEITWQSDWRTVVVAYTPSSHDLAESLWIQYSVPQLCQR